MGNEKSTAAKASNGVTTQKTTPAYAYVGGVVKAARIGGTRVYTVARLKSSDEKEEKQATTKEIKEYYLSLRDKSQGTDAVLGMEDGTVKRTYWVFGSQYLQFKAEWYCAATKVWVTDYIYCYSFKMSAKSDPISNKKMTGIVIYRWNNKTEWQLNTDENCQTGCTLVVNSDKIENIYTKRGSIHSKAWKYLFGNDMDDNENWEIVGGGFSIQSDGYHYTSGTFNEGKYTKDHFHDGDDQMSELEKKAIKCTLDNWRRGIQETHVNDMGF